MSAIRSLQRSNQASLRFASMGVPGAVSISKRRKRISSAFPGVCCIRSQSFANSFPANSSNNRRLRSCSSARKASRLWKASLTEPEPKQRAPTARSWPASSLPCTRLKSATSSWETAGLAAASATSKISEIRPAISRLKAVRQEFPSISWFETRVRSSGSASSPSNTQAIRERILAFDDAGFSDSAAMLLRSSDSTDSDSLMSFSRFSLKRLPDEARKRPEAPRSFCNTWIMRPVIPTRFALEARRFSSSASSFFAASAMWGTENVIVNRGTGYRIERFQKYSTGNRSFVLKSAGDEVTCQTVKVCRDGVRRSADYQARWQVVTLCRTC